jgi:hypothetical protein
MKIFSLYRDFFKFLDRITAHSEQWEIYFTFYYKPHRKFLETYFSHFPLINSLSLKQRVGAVKAAHYSLLRSLVSACPPEKIVLEAFEKCIKIVPPEVEPEVYLFIGFFSPDGFVMEFQGRPVICFGLERFKDFVLLRILFAHEYAHFLLNSSGGEVPGEEKIKWLLISEGLGTYFSYLAFPGCKLSDHFLFRRDRLNWCQANEARLRDVYCSGRFSKQELMDIYVKGAPELDIPPQAGKYLGFQAVKRYLAQDKERDIGLLFASKKAALSLEL